jgi:FtsZ-interacting cell division protein ZipA
MIEAITFLVIAGLIAICMLILIGDWMRRRFIDWREKRDRRIRDKPQSDPRTTRHRNYAVGREAK